jgi:acyl-CoA thioester hydrolase
MASRPTKEKTETAAEIVTYRGATYPWQCDHIGHMNIMWYVSKFDEANWNLFARVGITPSYLREARYGMAGVQQNITYKRELLAGDVIEVRSRILEVRERVIRFVHEMRNAERNEVAAICETTAVHLDRKTRKSCAFPPAVRMNAEKLSAQVLPQD